MNIVNGDGCTDTGEVESGWNCEYITDRSVCGILNDGLCTPGIEDCDNGVGTPASGCDADGLIIAGWGCTCVDGVLSICGEFGNGVITPEVEQCDDGGVVDGDGCSAVG